MIRFIQMLIISASMLTLASCTRDPNDVKDPVVPGNEEEIITSLILRLTDSSSQTISNFAFRDPDGDGGNAPTTFDTITLDSNRTYFAELILLNETTSPADTISHEIEEEKNDHQFFFTPSGNNLLISYLDKDDNNLPVGLKTKWITKTNFTGSVQVILKHQPGSKNGSQAPGETDIDLSFQVRGK